MQSLLCYSCLLQKLFFYSYSCVSIFLTIIQQYGFNLQSHTHLISTTKFPFGTVKLNKFQFFEIEYNFLVLFGSILGKYWRTFLTISISAGILDVEKSYAFFVSLSYEGQLDNFIHYYSIFPPIFHFTSVLEFYKLSKY